MKKNKQHGFSVIEGLLILVIVGLLGFVGWYVWNSQNITDKLLDSSAKSSGVVVKTSKKKIAPPPSAADPTANWVTYTSKTGQYSLKYPSNWVAAKAPKGCDSSDGALLLLGGNSSSVGTYCADGDVAGQVYVYSAAGNYVSGSSLDTQRHPDLKTQSVTVNGITGTKQTGTYKSLADDIGSGPINGEVDTQYVFYANSRTYYFEYVQKPGYPDVLSDFNLMVTKTLQFHP
jgi:type II secretory pathway pseudopilin PulG